MIKEEFKQIEKELDWETSLVYEADDEIYSFLKGKLNKEDLERALELKFILVNRLEREFKKRVEYLKLKEQLNLKENNNGRK